MVGEGRGRAEIVKGVGGTEKGKELFQSIYTREPKKRGRIEKGGKQVVVKNIDTRKGLGRAFKESFQYALRKVRK